MSNTAFIDVLRAARSRDDAIRKPAEEAMQKMENDNLVIYVGNLAQVLADETAPDDIRSLAGITLKNCASARSASRRAEHAARWLSQDAELRNQIHMILLNTLNSKAKDARNASSMAVAAFAAIELPANHWNDLIPGLLGAIDAQFDNTDFVCACFNTIGYIIDALDGIVESLDFNTVLNVIFKAVQTNVPQPVVLCAIRALDNSLAYCSRNFEVESEATMIMNMILSVVISENEDIAETAWKCLVQIATNYYETSLALSSNIQNVYEASVAVISSVATKPRAATQALEFWITVSEVEMDINEQLEDEPECGRTNHGFCNTACSYNLIEVVCGALVYQPEDPEDDDWCCASAAGLCLASLVKLLGASAAGRLLTFATSNDPLNNPNWRIREAATLVFGCLMESPSLPLTATDELLCQGIRCIVNLFSDPSPHVRNTAVWCISQVTKFHHELVLDGQLLDLIADNILRVLQQGEPKPAAYACIAVIEIADKLDGDRLVPFMTPFMNALLALSDQNVETKLLAGTFEAISQLVKRCPPQMLDFVVVLLPRFTQKLSALVSNASVQHASEELQVLQGLVCGTLESIISAVEWSQISQYSDSLMTVLLTLMKTKSTIVHEEALLTIGQLSRKAGSDFSRYMSTFCPILIEALSHTDELQLVQTALMTISTLATSFESGFLPYADVLFNALEVVMASSEIDKEAKLSGFDAYMDFALALGKDFVGFLPRAMATIHQASNVALWNQSYGDDLYDYCLDLTNRIIQCFIGITTAVCADGCAEALAPFAEFMIQFAHAVTQHPESSEADIATVCEFYSDILPYAFNISPTFPHFILTTPLRMFFATKEFRSRRHMKALKRARAAYLSFMQRGQAMQEQ